MHKDDAQFAHYHAFLALRIVAQAFQLVDPAVVSTFCHRAVAQTLTPAETLLAHVRDAQNAPHVAYLSVQILVTLSRTGLIPRLLQQDVPAAVQNAHVVGSHCHAALEQASGRLLREVIVRG